MATKMPMPRKLTKFIRCSSKSMLTEGEVGEGGRDEKATEMGRPGEAAETVRC